MLQKRVSIENKDRKEGNNFIGGLSVMFIYGYNKRQLLIFI
jgi:hypothetical protein